MCCCNTSVAILIVHVLPVSHGASAGVHHAWHQDSGKTGRPACICHIRPLLQHSLSSAAAGAAAAAAAAGSCQVKFNYAMPMDDLVYGSEFRAPLNISPRIKKAFDAAVRAARRVMGSGAATFLCLHWNARRMLAALSRSYASRVVQTFCVRPMALFCIRCCSYPTRSVDARCHIQRVMIPPLRV
jgi:hypothetical protein